MRRIAVAAAAFALAGTAFGEGDRVPLPAGDLVTRHGPSQRAVDPVGTRPRLSEDAGRTIAGEAGLVASARDDGAEAWFDSSTLCGAVDELLGPDVPRTTYDDKMQSILVPAASRDAAVRALADLRARVPKPIALEVTLTRTSTRDGVTSTDRLLHCEGHADPSRTLELADATDRRVVAGFDVELAQASSIGDPILAILRTGVSSDLCVTPMPDGRSAVVETVTRVSRDRGGEPIDLGHPGFGSADRCEVGFDEVGTCFRAENGQPTSVSWIGRDGSSLELTVKAAWTPPPPAGDPAVMVTPLFRSGFWGFLSVPGPETPHEELPENWGHLDQRTCSAEELAARAFPDPVVAALVKWNGSVMTLPASPPQTSGAPYDAVCAEADRILAGARVECLAVNVPQGAAVSLDEPLPEASWAVARYAGPVVLGLPLCATGGSERRFLADWDVEVAQSSRIPDPQIQQLATGHYLNLNARAGWVAVDLDLSRLDEMQRRTLHLAVGRKSLGVQGEKSSGASTDPMLPPETVAVETPTVASLRAVGAIPLAADGTGSMRRSGDALLGAGRELVVLVRVR